MLSSLSVSGTILGNVTAEDDDGPQLLHFYIPSNLIAFQYIDLQNKRGTNQGGVTVDLVLKKGLDRDTVSILFTVCDLIS